MVQRLIVPSDGSTDAWRAFDVAVEVARRADASVVVLSIEWDPGDRVPTAERINRELAARPLSDVDVEVVIRCSTDSIAAEIEREVEARPGSVVVMSSHGRGRSAALVGSIAEDVLERIFGPVIIVGPHATPAPFDGPLIVTVDGSEESEAALPLAAAWGIELGVTPWIVNVAETTRSGRPADVMESGYVAGLARELHAQSGHEVDFEELHGHEPSVPVSEFAEERGASMIVASSHGRSGLSRLTMGSVTAAFVRHATCPVMVMRLPVESHAHTKAGT